MNLLIVDDQSTVVNGLKKNLNIQKPGIDKVFTATSAKEARLIMMSFPVDILLTDIEMPEEDGLSLFRWTMEKYPQIDKNRLCETGGSYGGFMTNWIIGHTDRFCCTASQRSISNWLSFYGVSDIGPYFSKDQTAGDPWESPEKMWEHSPLKYAANVKTPTLFIHSDQDYRCPLEQGLQMYTALIEQGVETRLCLFHGENHELSRSGKPKHRIRRLQEITDWFARFSGK